MCNSGLLRTHVPWFTSQANQLHIFNSGPLSAGLIPIPVISMFHVVGKDGQGLSGISRGAHKFVLLDRYGKMAAVRVAVRRIVNWRRKLWIPEKSCLAVLAKQRMSLPRPRLPQTTTRITALASNGIEHKTSSPAKPHFRSSSPAV